METGYKTRILKAAEFVQKGYAGQISVQHDEWCPMLAGTSACKCVPDITLTTHRGVYDVTLDGLVVKRDTARQSKAGGE